MCAHANACFASLICQALCGQFCPVFRTNSYVNGRAGAQKQFQKPWSRKKPKVAPAKSTQNSQQGKNEGRTTGHVVVSLSGMCYWLRSKWMMISWKHIWVSNEICPFQSGASSCIAPAGIEQWYVIVLEWHPSLLLVYGWMWLNRRQYTNISFLIICPFYNAGDGRSIWWLFGRSSRWYRCGILSGHA